MQPQTQTPKNEAAVALGRLAKGHPKRLTQEERQRRSQQLNQARKNRWPHKSTAENHRNTKIHNMNSETTVKSETVNRWRKAHHAALETLIPGCKLSGLAIWRRLVRIEREAHRLAEDYCNGIIDSSEWEKSQWRIKMQVAKAFGSTNKLLPVGFFINGDPRGYALKLDPEIVTIPEGMHTDWGRYGVLAAQID